MNDRDKNFWLLIGTKIMIFYGLKFTVMDAEIRQLMRQMIDNRSELKNKLKFIIHPITKIDNKIPDIFNGVEVTESLLAPKGNIYLQKKFNS